MKPISFFIALILLATLGYAQLPSDLIIRQDAPQIISLQNVVPSSVKAIDGLNPELGLRKDWQIPNIGRYASWAVLVDQGDKPAGVPDKLLNFSDQVPEIPESIGNASGKNITIINESELVFL
jgi:hypothetical protein